MTTGTSASGVVVMREHAGRIEQSNAMSPVQRSLCISHTSRGRFDGAGTLIARCISVKEFRREAPIWLGGKGQISTKTTELGVYVRTKQTVQMFPREHFCQGWNARTRHSP